MQGRCTEESIAAALVEVSVDVNVHTGFTVAKHDDKKR